MKGIRKFVKEVNAKLELDSAYIGFTNSGFTLEGKNKTIEYQDLKEKDISGKIKEVLRKGREYQENSPYN